MRNPGLTALLLLCTALTSQNLCAQASGGGFQSVSWPSQGGQLADVNGDGKADLVYGAGSALYVRYSTGAGFGSAVLVGSIPVVNKAWSEQQGSYDVYASALIGDVDGNGRADIVFSNGTALLSTASGFRSVAWPGVAGGQLADFDGDRKADLVYSAGSVLYVRYSTGAAFGSPVQIGTLPVVGSTGAPDVQQQPIYAGIAVGDVDGNGRADILLSTGTALLSTVRAQDGRRR